MDDLTIKPKSEKTQIQLGLQMSDYEIVIDRSAIPLTQYPDLSHADVLRQVADRLDQMAGKSPLIYQAH